MRDPFSETQTSVSCKYGYSYNRTVVQSSIITEWDLVCDKARMVDLAQIVLMLGILIGITYIVLTYNSLLKTLF